MEKRRKTMCATCIYRTGELTRNQLKHSCHEHAHGEIQDETVACAGSCKPNGMELVDTPTPNRARWSKSVSLLAVAEVIGILLRKGKGNAKMSNAVRLHKFSKGNNNLTY
jgi:hypothetical protein